MATPVGHAIAGFAVSGFAKSPHTGSRISLLLLCGFVGAMPDLDIIPGIIVGAPAQYHQGITHSLGFALAVSGIIAIVYRIGGKSFSAIFLLCFAAYTSHLAIDLLGPDSRPPIGIPLFWPITDKPFISPTTILLGVLHARSTSTPTAEWIQGLLSLRNALAIIVEVLVVTPLFIAGEIFRRRAPICRSRELSKGKS